MPVLLKQLVAVIGLSYIFVLHAASGTYSSVLTVDPKKPSFSTYSFIDESIKRQAIEPDISTVEVVNQMLMSNELGERWATLTLKNLASGQRIVSEKQIYAIFADGDKKRAQMDPIKLKGNEVGIYTISFGYHKFPILYVYTRNQ